MPDIKVSRRKGFTFGTARVTSKKQEDESGIYLLDVKYDASPDMTYFEFNVPGRNGSSYYGNKYEDKKIAVKVGIYARTVAQRRQMQRELLSGIVGRKSRLVFLDEPNLFYEANCFDAIGISEGQAATEISITFNCSYCLFEFTGDATDIITADANYTVDELDIITNSQDWGTINSLTYKMISNNGNYEAKTFITITANTNCTSLSLNNGVNSFTLSNLVQGEVIFIDSEQMIVYKIVNNEKVSVMDRFTGKFLSVPTGESMITINGTSFDAGIVFEFKNTYIV